MKQHLAGRVGVRRPRHAVPLDDQRLAHGSGGRADHGVQPVQRVHAHRQLAVQPRVDQSAEVPARRQHLRHAGLRAHREHRAARPGDPVRGGGLPDGQRSDATLAASVSSASATRTSARCSWRSGVAYDSDHGRAWAGRDHVADAGRGVPRVGAVRRDRRSVPGHRRPARLRAPREPGRNASRAAQARGLLEGDRADVRWPRSASSTSASTCSATRSSGPASAGRRRRARARRRPCERGVGRDARRSPSEFGVENSQVSRARSDRNDRLHDGLRHHRC